MYNANSKESIEKKQTVLMVHNFYQIPGGEDTVVANEKKMLEENGHRVVLYTRSNSELKEMSPIKKLFLPFTAVFSFRTYRDIKRIIREEKIDIVHVHNTLTLISPSVYYAAIACNVPVVQMVHNFRFLCPGATFYRNGHVCEDCVTKGLGCAVKHKCYRDSRLQTLLCVINTRIHRLTGIYRKISYICLTEFNREKLLQLKQLKPVSIFVKPNFTSESNAAPEMSEDRSLAYIGRLEEIKGTDILLEACRILGKDAPRIVICGTGPMENWCREFIKENRLDNIHMLGFVSHDEALKIMSGSTFLVYPTRIYEGFPLSIIEAYSQSTPVICSDLGNAGSLIEDGVTGYKFETGSAESLAQTITTAMESADLRNAVADEYKKKYTSAENYRILMEIYRIVQCNGIAK